MDYYKQSVLSDIEQYADESDYKDKSIEEVREIAMMDDSITGNASGSYYCNRYKAQEAIEKSGILFDDEFLYMVKMYGLSLSELLEKGAESLDVVARCMALDLIDDYDIQKILDK